jgi:hypothetical protein
MMILGISMVLFGGRLAPGAVCFATRMRERDLRAGEVVLPAPHCIGRRR